MEQEVANNIYELASGFALRVVNLYKYLTDEKKEFVMSKQLLRAGTSIGANSFEGKNALLVKIVKATKPQILNLKPQTSNLKQKNS